MARIKTWHQVNYVTRKPSRGCQLCSKGAKVVIFVTGECPSNCYYCPVSTYRRKDIIFADEQQINELREITTEAKMISALGAGITGGEPSICLTRVITIIKLLKLDFGTDFHCHLYTSSALSQSQLLQLYHTGLDEIRFHPPMLKLTDKMREAITMATEFNWDVGIEIPAIPSKEEEISNIIDFALIAGLNFVNLNEFEFTESNYKALKSRGFETKNDASAAVKGSEELALRVLNRYKDTHITIHYCSSRYKDRIQLRNRLKRRAKNYAKDFDIITDEGLIRRAYIKVRSTATLKKLKEDFEHIYGIRSSMVKVDIEKKIIATAEYIARELALEIKEQYGNSIISIEIVEQYPFDGGIITYLEPLI